MENAAVGDEQTGDFAVRPLQSLEKACSLSRRPTARVVDRGNRHPRPTAEVVLLNRQLKMRESSADSIGGVNINRDGAKMRAR